MENAAVKPTSTSRQASGVLPVFQTPYHEDESIDFATLEREIDWLFERGADGVVMAMVSETLRLTDGERRKVAEFVCKRASGRGTAIISVGAESSYAACEHARHAAAVGATSVMAIPPVSVAISEDALRRYYERILAATRLPLIVQDASGYVGRPMSIQFQANLLKDFPDRVLFKPEATPIGPRLSVLRDATNGRAQIFEGSGGIALVDSFRRGIVGTMPGADLIQALVALWRALKAGDDKRAYELSLPISSLVAVQNSLDAFLAVEKYLLLRQGVFKNTVVRGPTGFTLDDETRREVDRLFELLQSAVAATQNLLR